MSETSTTQTPQPTHHEMPALAGIAAFIRWVEELITLLSGPLLTAGLLISLVALLTDGALLVTVPVLLYVWAVSQALGVDAQLVAAWDRARTALRESRWWALVGQVMLGLLLAYVAFVAAQVFAVEQSQHITEAEALAQLGMDANIWLIQRTALAVGLVCLSGWNRYHPPAKVRLTLEEEEAEIDRQTRLAKKRQELRDVQAQGAAALAAQGRRIFAAARGRDPKPPTGGGSPAGMKATESDQATKGVITPGEPGIIQLPPPAQRRAAARGSNGKRPKGKARESVEAQARAAWQPGMSVGDLERTAKISRNAASKWRKVLQAEAEGLAQ